MSDEEQQAFPDGLLNQDGMTLRDYFAAKAMQGLLANGWSLPYAHLVRDSYQLADEMLKAREA